MTEAQIQKAVFENLRKRGMPDLVYWHVPNGCEARRFSGFRAGVSDISILHQGRFYAPELKTLDGIASDDQLKFIHDVQRAGGTACVLNGLDEALIALKSWGLIR